MNLESITIQTSTPTEPIVPGRGFYQLEEDALYVQIGLYSSQRRFYSFLESPYTRLELDRYGKLIFIEVSMPRRRWTVVPGLYPPDRIEAADIRWLNFREYIKEPRFLTSPKKDYLKIQFTDTPGKFNYYLADKVIAQKNNNNELTAIWITDITDDLAGQEIGSFRKNLREHNPYFI